MAEKMEMGVNPQIGFTEMNKNRNVEDGIGGQMTDLYLIEIKDASKEVRGGDSETTFEERFEYRKFFGLLERTLMTQGTSPSNQMLLEKSF